MRSATKTFVGLAGIGVLVATAKLGLPTPSAAVENIAVSTGTDSTTSEVTATPTPTPTTKTTTKSTTKKTTKSSTSTTSGTGTTTATPTPTPTPAPVASSVSKTSSSISYRFGVVQVKVTKKGNDITSVDCLNCTATKGRSSAFPTLQAQAVSSNGSNFGNLGGATYTTDAFKQALDNALAKF